jgi:hypothetical protein
VLRESLHLFSHSFRNGLTAVDLTKPFQMRRACDMRAI